MERIYTKLEVARWITSSFEDTTEDWRDRKALKLLKISDQKLLSSFNQSFNLSIKIFAPELFVIQEETSYEPFFELYN